MSNAQEIIRGFTVKMTFDRSVEQEEFDKIIGETPVVLKKQGRVLRCLPFKKLVKMMEVKLY